MFEICEREICPSHGQVIRNEVLDHVVFLVITLVPSAVDYVIALCSASLKSHDLL